MMNLIQLLKLSLQYKASDLHLSSGEPPILRVDGDIQKLDFPILQDKELRECCLNLMTPEQQHQFNEEGDIDFSFETPGISRFRVNVFEQNRGLAVVFRTIPLQIPSLEELGMPTIFKEIANFSKGLVLITGPTGSGKSSSLAAIIDYINTHRALHILTLEDPIEFVHHSKRSLITQREILRDAKTFEMALRSALREDPDIILLGELRDLESIRLSITAAETGHLVLGTLHTASAAQTIDRLIDVFPGDEKATVRTLLADTLAAVISQTLIKRVDGKKGRVAAYEVMIATPAIRHLIRESKTAQIYSAIQTNRLLGMQTLEQHIQDLFKKQMISIKPRLWMEERKHKETVHLC
jgi:twitching motility protein PilT